ncbi:MAG: hypothetical protein MHPSP_000133, partial [Paramarteilia canceri]
IISTKKCYAKETPLSQGTIFLIKNRCRAIPPKKLSYSSFFTRNTPQPRHISYVKGPFHNFLGFVNEMPEVDRKFSIFENDLTKLKNECRIKKNKSPSVAKSLCWFDSGLHSSFINPRLFFKRNDWTTNKRLNPFLFIL